MIEHHYSCAWLKHLLAVLVQDELHNYQPHGHQYVLLHLLSCINCTPKSGDEMCISFYCVVFNIFCFYAVQTSLVLRLPLSLLLPTVPAVRMGPAGNEASSDIWLQSSLLYSQNDKIPPLQNAPWIVILTLTLVMVSMLSLSALSSLVILPSSCGCKWIDRMTSENKY